MDTKEKETLPLFTPALSSTGATQKSECQQTDCFIRAELCSIDAADDAVSFSGGML